METYQELKKRQLKELEEIPHFYAFTEDMLNSLIQEHGPLFKASERDPFFYIKEEEIDVYNHIKKRHLEELSTRVHEDDTFLKDAILHELRFFKIEDKEKFLTSLGFTEEELKTDTRIRRIYLLAENQFQEEASDLLFDIQWNWN